MKYQQTQLQNQSHRITAAAIIAGASLLMISCGGPSRKAVPQEQLNCTAQGTCQPIQHGGGSTLPQGAWTVLFADYEGTLEKSSTGARQAYLLRFYPEDVYVQTPQGDRLATFAALDLQSQGPVGAISVQTLLGLERNGERVSVGNGQAGSLYSFVSPTIDVPAISKHKIKLEIQLVYSGSQFFPAQSRIRIQDCGFSQSFCTTLQDVRFADVLRKR